jgi:tetratricopeptide (TPR) repeat protein
LFLVNTTDEYRDHVSQGLRVCRETLELYEVLDRDDWQQHPDWQRLPPADQARLAEDTRELLLLLAGARVRLARGDAAALEEALALLDRAEAIPDLPPCRALWEDRAAYRKQAGDRRGSEAAGAKARSLAASTARDHYLLAMTRGRQGAFAEAVRHLDEALQINPRHYWSWMQRGLCRQAQGEHALAAGDFGTCVGLWPDFAWGYFNRAGALAQCGNKAAAIADYTWALDRDRDLTSAFFNRGMLRLELGEYAPALSDFRQAQKQGREDATLYLSLGVALEGLRRHGEADAAFDAWAARPDAGEQANRQRRVYGFAVAKRLPQKARAAFERVLRDDPADAQALYGCAMLLDIEGRAEEALRHYNLALKAAPGLEEARRYRAVLLARNGQFQDARSDINICLSRERLAAGTLYAAACVSALQAARSEVPGEAATNTEEALRLLREAFSRGYGVDTAAADHDLDGVRYDPAFRRLRETYAGAPKSQ